MLLLPPRDMTIRPITDRVKESLFSILVHDIPDARVADLFCGTGSLGLEALSRGARHAIMVDKNPDALNRLRKNIARLHFEDRTTVLYADIFKRGIPGSTASTDEENKCNIVFVDPPYLFSRRTSPDSDLGKLLITLSAQAANHALVIVRHEKRSELLPSYQNLHVQDRREYGSMAITFLKNVLD
jgi:16S rRNA (guanine966-N2)-methyltransferase